MIKKFGDFSVQAKLATIFMVICSSLVLLMSFLFVVDKVFFFRASMVENHTMMADTIAKNSTAALLFDDRDTAVEVLSALRVVADVEKAVIYTAEGMPFATYEHKIEDKRVDGDLLEAPTSIPIPVTGKSSYTFSNNYLVVTTPIVLEEELVGSLYLRANLKHLNNRLLTSIAIILTLVVILGVLAQMVSVQLHRFIANPLIVLLETMEMVKREKIYSYRVKRLNNDEFGELTDGFNSMLSEIEKRELELARHRDDLEALVDKRTKELLLSNQRLKLEVEERKEIQDKLARAQRMEAIGTLAAGVAHDLNNILSGVVSYPELLLMRLDKKDEMYGPLCTIKKSGNKAAAIVQDLLTLARRGGTVVEVIDLEVVVDEYLESAEGQKMLGLYPGVEITKVVEKDVTSIKGSSVHLSKTVMNLLTNAAEAIESDGNITITFANCYLDRPIYGYQKVTEGDYVRLQVKDSGHGISEEDLRFIFEPFYTKKKMGISGTGLGMAVVWGTVEDHKGYIDVISSPGNGATFDLYFPATSELLKQEETEERLERRGQGESVLVVDDLKEQRIIASSILRELGYVANTVASGEEAIVFLKDTPVDLLLLDMIMDPGIDGIETYRQALQINPRQRALIASGYSEMNRVEAARQLGVFVYLPKPYTVTNLAKVVREELDRKQASN